MMTNYEAILALRSMYANRTGVTVVERHGVFEVTHIGDASVGHRKMVWIWDLDGEQELDLIDARMLFEDAA